jgi:hypothetical protein
VCMGGELCFDALRLVMPPASSGGRRTEGFGDPVRTSEVPPVSVSTGALKFVETGSRAGLNGIAGKLVNQVGAEPE